MCVNTILFKTNMEICALLVTQKKGWHPIESLFFLDDVVAWIPLPKEYKADMESEE